MVFWYWLRMVEPLMSAPALVPAISRCRDHQAGQACVALAHRMCLMSPHTEVAYRLSQPGLIAKHANLLIHHGPDLLQTQRLLIARAGSMPHTNRR